MQYFIGDFDGTTFTPIDKMVRWLDRGTDFYAAISFATEVEYTSHKIIIGWLSNWDYTRSTPTSGYRGQMSVPRILQYHHDDKCLSMTPLPWDGIDEHSIYFDLLLTQDACYRIGDESEYVSLQYDSKQKLFVIDRSQCVLQTADIHKVLTIPLEKTLHCNPTVKIHIVIDTHSVEIFISEGAQTITFAIYPTSKLTRILTSL